MVKANLDACWRDEFDSTTTPGVRVGVGPAPDGYDGALLVIYDAEQESAIHLDVDMLRGLADHLLREVTRAALRP